MTDLLHWVRPHCVTSPYLLAGLILWNAWVAYCYLRIPGSLTRIIRKSGGPIAGGAVRGSAVFVGSCGITHLLTIAVLFAPSLDWLAVGWGLWTGAISLWTWRHLHAREGAIIQAILDARQLEARLQ